MTWTSQYAEELLEHHVKPALILILQEYPDRIRYKDDIRLLYNKLFSKKISKVIFNRWAKDLGLSMKVSLSFKDDVKPVAPLEERPEVPSVQNSPPPKLDPTAGGFVPKPPAVSPNDKSKSPWPHKNSPSASPSPRGTTA